MSTPSDLVAEHVAIARAIARRLHRCHGGRLPDMIQDGLVGLFLAARAFDASRGFKFTTYARRWVRGVILNGLMEAGGVRRVTSGGVPRRMRLGSVPLRSGGLEAGEGLDVADGRPGPLEAAERRETGARLDEILAGLGGRREVRAFRLYFLEGWTARRIGGLVGASESTVTVGLRRMVARLRACRAAAELAGASSPGRPWRGLVGLRNALHEGRRGRRGRRSNGGGSKAA